MNDVGLRGERCSRWEELRLKNSKNFCTRSFFYGVGGSGRRPFESADPEWGPACGSLGELGPKVPVLLEVVVFRVLGEAGAGAKRGSWATSGVPAGRPGPVQVRKPPKSDIFDFP